MGRTHGPQPTPSSAPRSIDVWNNRTGGPARIRGSAPLASGGATGYQTLINEALKRSIDAPSLEAMVRRAIREELKGKLDAA